MRRAIITGATGAIGMALAELLIKENIEVLVLTRSESKRNERLKALADSFGNGMINIVECDFAKLSEMENDTGKDWDCFFHLAWAGASGPGRNDMYLQNGNVRMSLDAVALAKRFGCRKFVGAGSQAEYGRSYMRIGNETQSAGGSVNFDERYRLRPDTPAFPEMGYGYAKLCAGQMTRDYAHQLGLEHNWLRVISVFGPYDGESILKQAVRSFKAGISPDFTKGEQIWDFVYSKDAALAFYDVAEKGTDGKTYVLGSGAERPLAEYLSIARDIICPGLELKLGTRPYGENQVMFLAADTSELKNDTGFECRYTFEDGIRDMMGFSDNQ
ncbi:MAG: NAD(P)-dependent oxidoreductase [Lachnospiraceae bacterium]|nr:NAD(P)-dependent oxidoreductase [Lachnospiraceae bacterium]